MQRQNNNKKSKSFCLFCIPKSRPVESQKSVAKRYLEFIGLQPEYIHAELFMLSDNEALLLRRLYDSGLRGTHIRAAKRHQNYPVLAENFLFPNDEYDSYFPDILATLMKTRRAPEEAFTCLLELCQQKPEALKIRFNHLLQRQRNTVWDVCQLYKNLTEEEAERLHEEKAGERYGIK